MNATSRPRTAPSSSAAGVSARPIEEVRRGLAHASANKKASAALVKLKAGQVSHALDALKAKHQQAISTHVRRSHLQPGHSTTAPSAAAPLASTSQTATSLRKGYPILQSEHPLPLSSPYDASRRLEVHADELLQRAKEVLLKSPLGAGQHPQLPDDASVSQTMQNDVDDCHRLLQTISPTSLDKSGSPLQGNTSLDLLLGEEEDILEAWRRRRRQKHIVESCSPIASDGGLPIQSLRHSNETNMSIFDKKLAQLKR